MAKPKVEKNSFGKGPWEMKKAEVESFILVTPTNVKQAKVFGRIFYVIEKSGNKYFYNGCFAIEPCLLKGWWKWPWMPHMNKKEDSYRTYIDKDMSRDEWTSFYKFMLDSHIEKGELYIKQGDPILTYIKE
jgi:hypothetical protein